MQCIIFFFNDTATTEIYTLSLHDALPISPHVICNPGQPQELPRKLQSVPNLTTHAIRLDKRRIDRIRTARNHTSIAWVHMIHKQLPRPGKRVGRCCLSRTNDDTGAWRGVTLIPGIEKLNRPPSAIRRNMERSGVGKAGRAAADLPCNAIQIHY